PPVPIVDAAAAGTRLRALTELLAQPARFSGLSQWRGLASLVKGVMRSMHIYGDTLERYAARELPEQHLAALDSHVSNCLFCAHGLADQTALSTAWERRGWL